MLIRMLNRLILVLFLFSFLNTLNESKEHEHLQTSKEKEQQHEEDNKNNNSVQNLIKKFHQNSKHYSTKDFKLIKDMKASSKRLLEDLKIHQRNQMCSSLKNEKCSQLPPECLNCDFNMTCVYGIEQQTTCRPFKGFDCEGPNEFIKPYTCAYCYQLPESNYTCNRATTCKPHIRYLTNCTTDKKVFCLGNRKFNKFIKCESKSNIKWNYALIFSITLGGFGVDRFYLGNWQEGFGKLFSFGGLGFWTLIDVILIWVGYLKPSDGNYS